MDFATTPVDPGEIGSVKQPGLPGKALLWFPLIHEPLSF